MARSRRVSSPQGAAAARRYSLDSLPPVKLDRLTKWEQIQMRMIRKQRRAHRRRGLDRKLAHINFTTNDNMQDSEGDDSISENEGEVEHTPYDSSDECYGHYFVAATHISTTLAAWKRRGHRQSASYET
ncbi:uncharacterized protein PG986_007942 [Apiospora aurea]|uniref:Uncharacterized protein n=1 Tax=Apiospora aurea TaxID=335848 RepID=A0ABR1QE86_9PEZI